MYIVEENQVVFEIKGERHPLHAVDIPSFRVLKDTTLTAEQVEAINQFKRSPHLANQMVATDGNQVWYLHLPIPGADAGSFEYFHGGQCYWGRDRHQLYCFYSEGKNPIKIMKSRSPSSFGFFDLHVPEMYARMYAHDAEHVYYYGRRVRGATPGSFAQMTEECYDVRKGGYLPPSLSTWYFRDDRQLYYYGQPCSDIDVDTAFLVALVNTGGGAWVIVGDRNGFYTKGKESLREHYPAFFDKLPPKILDRQRALAAI
jgi:hypothetical protein